MGLLARTPIYTHCGVYIYFQPTKYTLEINDDHFQRTHQRQLSIVQALLLKDLAGRVVTAISQPGAYLGILTGLDTPFLIHSLEVSKRLKSFSPTHWNKSFGFPGPLCITLPRVTNVQKREDFFVRLCVSLIVCVSSRLFWIGSSGCKLGVSSFIFLLGPRSVKLCVG